MNFITALKEGLVTVVQIEDYIESWHEGDSTLEIYDYLGLTEEDYKQWVEHGDKYLLKFI